MGAKMNTDNQNVLAIPVAFYVGLGLYIASFFLIAVDEYPGYRCAYITLSGFRTAFQALFFYPGLINPLIIAFVTMKFLNEAPRLRLCLAVAAILLFIPTWLIVMSMAIKLGCAMWVVSILLITAGDIGDLKIRLLRGKA
jgi:hypothetical protein